MAKAAPTPVNQPPGQAMGANDFGKLRSWLAQQHFSQAQIDAAIGTAHGGRSYQQIEAALTTFLQTLPKG